MRNWSFVDGRLFVVVPCVGCLLHNVCSFRRCAEHDDDDGHKETKQNPEHEVVVSKSNTKGLTRLEGDTFYFFLFSNHNIVVVVVIVVFLSRVRGGNALREREEQGKRDNKNPVEAATKQKTAGHKRWHG